MPWRDNEKTSWCERGPFPFSEVGIKLTAHLVFIVRNYIPKPRGSDAMRKLEMKEAKRIKELEAGLIVESDDEVDVDDDDLEVGDVASSNEGGDDAYKERETTDVSNL